MRGFVTLPVLAGALLIGTGCMSENYRRSEYITDGAGNSQAANTVMQMVDPWQDGVQNTRLLVPAARASQPGLADDAAAAKDAQTSSN